MARWTSCVVAAAIGLGAVMPVGVRTEGLAKPESGPFITRHPELRAALERIARGSASWRAGLASVAATGRSALVVTPDDVVVADDDAVKRLADLAKEFPGLAVLVLHHTTKATPDDPVAAISGTYGLTAAADNYMILLKQGQQFRLHVGGRLWALDDADFELTREAGGWTLGGTWAFSGESTTPKQQQVLALLKDGAKTAKALAKATGQDDSAMRHMCSAMSAKGLIQRVANGWEMAR